MSAGNTSTAVRARRAEAADSLDDFPTPPWATRALTAFLRAQGVDTARQSVWEPACNRGHMARPLAEAFALVHASDVAQYGWDGQTELCDYLMPEPGRAGVFDWIITNPPYRLGLQFVARALVDAREGVALLLRTQFQEGRGRYNALFRRSPPTYICPFVDRVVMWKGVLLDPDVPVWHAPTDTRPGEMKKPTTATSYAWFIWHKSASHDVARLAPLQRPLAAKRAELTRPGDYPPLTPRLLPPASDGPGGQATLI